MIELFGRNNNGIVKIQNAAYQIESSKTPSTNVQKLRRHGKVAEKCTSKRQHDIKSYQIQNSERYAGEAHPDLRQVYKEKITATRCWDQRKQVVRIHIIVLCQIINIMGLQNSATEKDKTEDDLKKTTDASGTWLQGVEAESSVTIKIKSRKLGALKDQTNELTKV